MNFVGLAPNYVNLLNSSKLVSMCQLVEFSCLNRTYFTIVGLKFVIFIEFK